ncbi:MAG TPA: tetratricopeptide repeat protein, partial [Candidatus Manganitrophaceae bacterium]
LTLPTLHKTVDSPRRVAAIAALLWATHPIQTEAVTYIIQRMTSLSSFFYLLSFVLYIRGRKAAGIASSRGGAPRWYAGAAAAALFSFGAKEIAATLPIMIILYDLLFFCAGETKKIRKAAPAYLLLLALTGGLAFLYLEGLKAPLEAFQEGMSKQYGIDPYPTNIRLLTESRVLVYYLSLLIFPHPARLNIDHDFPPSSSLWGPPTTLLSIATLGAGFLIALIQMRKRPVFSFFIFWYLGNLIVESSFIRLDLVFEHRLYLPSISFFLAVGAGLSALKFHRLGKWAPALPAACLAAILFFQSIWTIERNRVWRDEVTLWEDTVKKTPRKARPYKALGTAYAEQGRFDEAIEAFYQALKINGNYAKVYTNLGVVYYKKGETARAVEAFQKSIALNRKDALAYYNLANIFTDQDRWDDAVVFYRKAAEILQNEPMIRHNLGYALSRKGMTDEAIREYLTAIREENPLAGTHKNLAALYLHEGNLPEAIDHYREAGRLAPDDETIHLMLGRLYKKEKLFDLALREFREAAALKPGPAVFFNMGTVLDQQKNWEEAIQAYRKAIELDSKWIEAYINLGVIYQKQNKYESAMQAFLEAMRLQPKLPEAHNNLGYLYQQRGLTDLARLEYLLALKFRPEWDIPRINLNALPPEPQKVIGALTQ